MPPIEFAPLRELLPNALNTEVAEPLPRKAGANEKTVVTRPEALTAFMRDELVAGQAARESLPVVRAGSAAVELDALFGTLLHAAFPA